MTVDALTMIRRQALATLRPTPKRPLNEWDEPEVHQPPVMREPDRVGRIERQSRGRQPSKRRTHDAQASGREKNHRRRA